MPSIGTQTRQHITNIAKQYAEAQKYYEDASKLLDEAERQKEERRQLLNKGLAITIGFTKQCKYCFIAYYDYALGARLVLDNTTDVDLEFWSRWKKRFPVVQQYETTLDLRPHLRTLAEYLKAGYAYSMALCIILNLAGCQIPVSPQDAKPIDLFTFMSTSPLFTEANPADYIGDITDDP